MCLRLEPSHENIGHGCPEPWNLLSASLISFWLARMTLNLSVCHAVFLLVREAAQVLLAALAQLCYSRYAVTHCVEDVEEPLRFRYRNCSPISCRASDYSGCRVTQNWLEPELLSQSKLRIPIVVWAWLMKFSRKAAQEEDNAYTWAGCQLMMPRAHKERTWLKHVAPSSVTAWFTTNCDQL